MPKLLLKYGLKFRDLYSEKGLFHLDQVFSDQLQIQDPGLFDRFHQHRQTPNTLNKQEESALILDLVPFYEAFMADLFGIEKEMNALRTQHDELSYLSRCKSQFIQKRALYKFTADEAQKIDIFQIIRQLEQSGIYPKDELNFAKTIIEWLKAEDQHKAKLEVACQYCAWVLHTQAGRLQHKNSFLFSLPQKQNLKNLIPTQSHDFQGSALHKSTQASSPTREGFDLTDSGMNLAESLGEAHYCIYCHNKERDSCSIGLKDKKSQQIQSNDLGNTLAGCPLDQKISEMHFAKAQGYALGALAIIAIDNPMVAGTGHRICNDCMKSCIFQKQDPVNTPSSETEILKTILALPWGFELYSLITRWNPLNFQQSVSKPSTPYKVLVVGMGPAGYTLAHHLLNQGHTVVGIDGLKIEPLPHSLSGVDSYGIKQPFHPVHSITDITDKLSSRLNYGFGGVAEYGITARWDKNFLKIIRMQLERRENFALFGGMRFGGAITIERAKQLGFDHIALCMGAGKPKILPIKNNLAKGVRTASDFLMGLQLTGAMKKDSIANLQLRLPIAVIGGGLTAIDTATEALAYYPEQVEKFLTRYEALVKKYGPHFVRSAWSEEEQVIADEMITHAKAIRLERIYAREEHRKPNIHNLLKKWGGCTVIYRKTMQESPAYCLNHHELHSALTEGIQFAECLTPQALETDDFGWVQALETKTQTGYSQKIHAKTVLIAVGTEPNLAITREYPESFEIKGQTFKPMQGQKFFTQYHAQNGDTETVSFFGDLHPDFEGSVVKAMASAKNGYPHIDTLLHSQKPQSIHPRDLINQLNTIWRPRIHSINRLKRNIIELVVYAPEIVHAHQPGQFYRLQNLQAFAGYKQQTSLAFEGLAITGARVDSENGLISLIVLESGGASKLCQSFKSGDPLILMGPTGTPSFIPKNQTVALFGGGLGNAILFSIGQAMRNNGCKVLYFAGYRSNMDIFLQHEIENAADQVVWCCEHLGNFTSRRPQDHTFEGNIVQALENYTTHSPKDALALKDVKHMLVIGPDRMMQAIKEKCFNELKTYFHADLIALAGVNSPMQCMMKEICGQCLQSHTDPTTGKQKIIFSCTQQDQSLGTIDFSCLQDRLKQNSLTEKLTSQWIESVMNA